MQYVGETKRPLRERFSNHRSDIKLQRNTAISIHFNEINHSITDLTVIPIEQISQHTERKLKENFWTTELRTRYPFGLNHYPLPSFITS